MRRRGRWWGDIQAPRYSKVPWIVTHLDLEEGQRFLWEIEYHRDADKALCMRIADPFYTVPEQYLILHAVRGNGQDGGEIGLSISETPLYDVFARDTFRIHLKRPDETE